MSKIKEWIGYEYVSEDSHPIEITGETTVLTVENYGALVGILDVMQEQLLEDLNYADLTDRGAEVLNSDYQRLSDIKKQLTLTMEVIKL